ncbi:hypothetical protein D3C81_1189710 [compost metagenome]
MKRCGQLAPVPDLPGEPHGALAQYRQPRPAVLAALVVVGGAGEQGAGELLLACPAGRMEVAGRHAQGLRIAADVVAPQCNRRAIAGGIFQRLGGDGRRQLLEASQRLPAQPAQPTDRQAPQRFAAQHPVEPVQGGMVGFLQPGLRRLARQLEVAPILCGASADAGIGAVDREGEEQLEQ